MLNSSCCCLQFAEQELQGIQVKGLARAAGGLKNGHENPCGIARSLLGGLMVFLDDSYAYAALSKTARNRTARKPSAYNQGIHRSGAQTCASTQQIQAEKIQAQYEQANQSKGHAEADISDTQEAIAESINHVEDWIGQG